MAPTRLITVIGRKNAGKTTLIVALAREFTRRKLTVATIKHGHHPALADTEGKDTWRHYHEGLAARVLIEAPGERVLFERADEPQDPIALARRFMSDTDIVLIEGFHASALPKVEVFRPETGAESYYQPNAADQTKWVAMVTTDPSFQAPFPVIRFNDTAWLVTLAGLVWNGAKVLTS